MKMIGTVLLKQKLCTFVFSDLSLLCRHQRGQSGWSDGRRSGRPQTTLVHSGKCIAMTSLVVSSGGDGI